MKLRRTIAMASCTPPRRRPRQTKSIFDPLCCAGEGLIREFRSCSLNCGHSIKLFGQIDSQKQGAWAEALSLCDKQRSIRTVNFDWICADPRTHWFALESADKLGLRHDAPPHFSRRETMNNAPLVPVQCKRHQAGRQRPIQVFPPRLTIPVGKNFLEACSLPRKSSPATAARGDDVRLRSEAGVSSAPRYLRLVPESEVARCRNLNF